MGNNPFDKKLDENFKQWIKLRNKWSIIILAVLSIILFMELYMPLIMHWSSEYYIKDKLKEFSNNYTQNIPSTEDKATALLRWEYANYKGVYTYGQLPFIPFIRYKGSNFKICQRTDKDNDPSWIFFSKCGACGESAMLYAELVSAIGLKSRVIKNPGEDHSWDEVLINNTWIVMDPSWNATNVPRSYYGEAKNLSYVFYEENGRITDITREYTNKTGVLIIKIPEKYKNPDIKVISHFLSPHRDSEYNCRWINNTCEAQLGINNYTLIVTAGKFIRMYDKQETSVEQDSIKELEFKPNRIYLVPLIQNKITVFILCFLLVVFFWGCMGIVHSLFKTKKYFTSNNVLN